MRINPSAVVFWLLCAGIGYLSYGTIRAAVIGAVVGISISLIIGLLCAITDDINWRIK